MAWLDEYKAQDGTRRIRLLDRIDGKQVTIVRDLGRYPAFAEDVKAHYRRAKTMGLVFKPPIEVSDIEGFLKSKSEGRDYEIGFRRITIEEMCDLNLRLHGPSLKGGVSDHYKSAYHGFRLRMEQIKRAWAGRFGDEISKLDVRDYLLQFKTNGTKLRNLNVIGKMFKNFEDWNEEELIDIKGPVRLPKFNPAKKWREAMLPKEKLELPDQRVISRTEWENLIRNSDKRIIPILEVSLQRFLRLSDIKKITYRSISNGFIKGLQEKTGNEFSVPMMANHSKEYDFTNFTRLFREAQERAGLLYPPEHPLHFSLKDLRRTGATWYYNKTGNLRKVQRMLGHKKLSTTERYLHITEEDLNEVAEVMDELAKIAPNENRTRISSLRGTRPNR